MTCETKSSKKVLKLGLFSIGAFLILSHLCAWIFKGNAWFYSQTIPINKLSELLSDFKKMHIKEYRNQDWCKILDYQKGFYGESTYPSNCFPLDPKTIKPITLNPFNQEINADFSTLNNKILLSGLRIYWITVDFNDSDEIYYSNFELENFGLLRLRFIYSPEKSPSENSEWDNYFIQPFWYYQIEDWM